MDACLPSKVLLAKRTCVGKKQNKRNLTMEEAGSLRQTKQGFLLSHVIHSHMPTKYNVVQSALGVELWRHGTSHSSFKCLHTLGVCVSVTTARRAADAMLQQHQQTLTKWKEDLQAQEDPLHGKDKKSYSLCYDNVQFTSHRKHHTSTKANRFIIGALGFAVSHRTPSLHLPCSPTKSALSLPASTFFPSTGDFEELKSRMNIIVQRIAVDYLPGLQSCAHLVKRHIPHKYSQNMKEQSQTVNLGLVDANPSSIKGTLTVMDALNQHVPTVDGEVHPIPCNGDGLSVERMVQAKFCRVDPKNTHDQFGGLVEAPQEFHKEGLLLQDTMNKLYKSQHLTCRGTLFNIKEIFGHRGIKSNVMHSFQHVWDLVKFATEGLVTLQLMQLCGMKDVNDTPEMPSSRHGRRQWLESLANRVVERCWQEPSMQDIATAMESYQPGNSSSAFTLGDNRVGEHEGCDDMLKYTLSLMWHGLNHMVRRDAVREGDGAAILKHWRLDLHQMWTHRHHKYVKIAHRFLSYASGVLPPRLAHEITWERVANLTGKPAGNIGLDLVNEFLNNDFKEMTRRSRRAYTEDNLKRCSMMGGGFSRDVTRLMTKACIGAGSRSTYSCTRDKAEVAKFVEEYAKDRLVDNIPSRSGPSRVVSCGVRDPKGLGDTLRSQSDQIDAWHKQSKRHFMS